MITQHVSALSKLPVGGLGGSVHHWERTLDPWHEEAFPDEFKNQAPRHDRQRRKGWMAYDAWNNPLIFLADGDELPAL